MPSRCFVLLMELLKTNPEKALSNQLEVLLDSWDLAVEMVYSELGVAKKVYEG